MTTIAFSKEAAQVLQEANDHANRNQHQHVDGPHILWSLVRNSQAGREWLVRSGCKDSDEFVGQLEACFPKWFEQSEMSAEPSTAYLQAMRAAADHAAETNSPEIAAAHILKAVLDQDSLLGEWLRTTGLRSPGVQVVMPTPFLDELGRDLTRLAREGKLGPVVGREHEVTQVIEVLMRHGKNSVLLLGLPGVGKTAVVERLAQDIASGNVPAKLRNARLIELNVSLLIAGTTYRGQLEERLQALLAEIQRTDDVILVIDEFHTLMGAGKTEGGSIDAANMLKPALARGELTCIGITTQAEFARHIEVDQALVRRFHPITVEEPTTDETLAILQQLAPDYDEHHQTSISPQALETIIKLTAQYLPARQFPDKAIDVLGKACSRAEIQQLDCVDETMIATVVSEMAGIPIGQVSGDLQSMLTQLEQVLEQSVVGQDEAVRVLSQAVRLAYAGLRDPRRPRGVFLFVGPTGVGKTQLARSLAACLFGTEKSLIRLDMSEFAEKHSTSRLIGAPPGYVGYEEPGQLTQPLRDRPYRVVLLDEIEKAHPEIFDIFLQLFDEGRLTDAQGHLVDGRHAIFIMTSNLGNVQQSKRVMGFHSQELSSQSGAEEALRSFFRPEFLNRLDHIIHFRALDVDDLAEIARNELRMLKERMTEQHIRLTFAADIADYLAQEAAKGDGARGLKRVVERLVSVPISEALLTRGDGRCNWLHIELEQDTLRLGWV